MSIEAVAVALVTNTNTIGAAFGAFGKSSKRVKYWLGRNYESVRGGEIKCGACWIVSGGGQTRLMYTSQNGY